MRAGVECRERLESSQSANFSRIFESVPTSTTAESTDGERVSNLPRSTAHLSQPKNQPAAPSNPLPPPISPVSPPEVYRERTSTYEVVDQLFKEHSSTARLTHTADAIPGGSPDSKSNDAGIHYFSIQDVLGSSLPPPHVTEFCLESYLDAVHWFMILFHEPSLRAGIEDLAKTGYVREDRVSFLILVALVIAVGAKYAAKRDAEARCPGFDLENLGNTLIRKTEERLLDVFDEAHIEAIQIAIILSSYYIYHSRPNRSLAMNGSAQKLAFTMGLHKESSWKMHDPIVREVWRRLCWALYTAEV
jgi:hypothetical protein